jgi:hypothetical protein
MGSLGSRASFAFNGIDTGDDNRSGREILESARDYCEYRAKRLAHGQLSLAKRFSPERLWYLSGITGIIDILYGEKRVGIAPTLPLSSPSPERDPRAVGFASQPRASLVAQLMEANPSLTDRKLLSGLQKNKLANMLCAALDAAPAQERLRA